MESIFVSKNYIYDQYNKGKNLILFGASEISRKTKRTFKQIKFSYIIDNSQNLWGQQEEGLKIFSAEKLKKVSKNKSLIVITTTSFNEVKKQLNKMGFKDHINFVVSPVLNDLISINQLEQIKSKIIFSSGAPPLNSKEEGGGIYELIIDREKHFLNKKISGNCYGIIHYRKNFITIDNNRGIVEFNKNYKIIRSQKLPKNIRPHGISYSEEFKNFYVVCSNTDEILVLSQNFELKDSFKLSSKAKASKIPIHHANDCFVSGNSLYVSMFSETGNFINDIFDGAICEYDLINKKKIGTPVKNLWMPHNISKFNNDFYLLDSLRGNLLGNNMTIQGTFNAFTRGLDYHEDLFYVGQSKNRNFSKTMGISNNNSIDCGIIIFNNEKKISRFFQFPPSISEIHSLRVIKTKKN